MDFLVPGNPNVDFASLQGDEAAVAIEAGVVTTHLAAAHTLFNITNTLMMLPFTKQLEQIVTRWIPTPASEPRDVWRYVSRP